MISQTSGHGDFRLPYEVPAQLDAPLSRGEVTGAGMIADGVAEVLKRRANSSCWEPARSSSWPAAASRRPTTRSTSRQYTEAELRAAVDAAENWGTYVTVHAYTPRAIQTAIRGGVRCIDHGQLMDEETAKIMADKDIWFSSQAFIADGLPTPTRPARQRSQADGHVCRNGHGLRAGQEVQAEDCLGHRHPLQPGRNEEPGRDPRHHGPLVFNDEILLMATGVNADLLAMSGPRNPYPGRIGVIEPDAYADILLVDGDPIADIGLLADPEKNLKIIMKDGRIYKDTMRG